VQRGFIMPILLDQRQFLAVANAAAALFPSDRDPFIAAVAAELEGQPLGDGSLGRAIARAQSRFSHPEPEARPPRWGSERPSLKPSKRAY
jgi:hypothetical protein